jgi:hypothetical protein
MVFPFSIKYSKKLADSMLKSDKDLLLTHIAEFLKKRKARNIKVSDNQLEFSTSLFEIGWGINLNVIMPIEKGKFIIVSNGNKERLTYEFSMYRLILVALIGSIFVGLVGSDLSMGLIFFGFLGGLNWIIALIRQGLMLNKILKDYQNVKKISSC